MSARCDIAVVGMACRYPDAETPGALWENVLAQRRAFRPIPDERLPLDDYGVEACGPDGTYVQQAALLEGYAFDRARFRVSGPAYRSTDLAHWVALDVASDALRDASLLEGERLPRRATGVILGNTLTGDLSRAQALRLRWPYVRRVVEEVLLERGLAPDAVTDLVRGIHARYSEPFEPFGEDSLAGGLSNTIAGRICNHFDLGGGGYVVDGACASSLLAVIRACDALVAGDLDVALAGGVDVSLDPFELVGFARLGALARDDMRVYDADPQGFWPGEGCGMVVLMRGADAEAAGHRVYARLCGWGLSSDGEGGITRPEPEGQRVALERAYRRASFEPASLGLVEGHGTGTKVGDATELRVLNAMLRNGRAALGSIKANVGHTKAAAGAAGLIKALLAVHHQILPPATGCREPHPELGRNDAALRILTQPEPWPQGRPLRAGVSAMGFGGINTHVVLEGPSAPRVSALSARQRRLATTPQDAELLLIGAETPRELHDRIERLRHLAARVSETEWIGLAACSLLEPPKGGLRGAITARRRSELDGKLAALQRWIGEGTESRLDAEAGVFLGRADACGGIGFLFAGQGVEVSGGGALSRRFSAARRFEALMGAAHASDTAHVQPAVVASSRAALAVLDRLGVQADVAVGHSLGELVALHWGGVFDGESLQRLASERGRAMSLHGAPGTGMLALRTRPEVASRLVSGQSAVLSAYNAPEAVVVSGTDEALAAVRQAARRAGIAAAPVRVSHGFHSPWMASAATALRHAIEAEPRSGLRRRVISTITGSPLAADDDVAELLVRQLVEPVRFHQAIACAARDVALWLEVGPGRVLSGLLAGGAIPAISLDIGSPRIEGVLRAVGAAFCLGRQPHCGALLEGREVTPFRPDHEPRLIVNPCERTRRPRPVQRPQRPASSDASPVSLGVATTTAGERRAADAAWAASAEGSPGEAAPGDAPCESGAAEPRALLRALIASRTELPEEGLRDDDRLLSDLHLSSIGVFELLAEASARLDVGAPADPARYADASIRELAEFLAELLERSGTTERGDLVGGVAPWVRCFEIRWVESPRPTPARRPGGPWKWSMLGDAPEELGPLLEARAGRDGILVHLPAGTGPGGYRLLLEAARRALASRGPSCFVLVHRGDPGSSMVRTLQLEARKLTTCVLELPPGDAASLECVVEEVAAARDHSELRLTRTGRFERRLVLASGAGPSEPMAPGVWLMTGGGKGIGAACALALARRPGMRLGLIGRADPDRDPTLAENLRRVEAAGGHVCYVAADVCDLDSLRRAVAEIEAALGPVTSVVHAAGRNQPRLLAQLQPHDFEAELEVKLGGARNLLDVLDARRLRAFVSFGSVIAETGMAGEAHYAFANECLADFTEVVGRGVPGRFVTLEWSAWSGAGMGERLSTPEALAARGIAPIDPEDGTRALLDLLDGATPAERLVVAGRLGHAVTLAMGRPELPFLRFLDHARVYVPGVELVCDSEIGLDADPYLDDHALHGTRLFPAVMALEAFAQVSAALLRTDATCSFEAVAFTRPVVIRSEEPEVIRIAALVRGPDRVELSLRTASSGFRVDHFRAICRLEPSGPTAPIPGGRSWTEPVLDPADSLYGPLFFQRGVFQRVRRYLHLTSTECVAELRPGGAVQWFARYLPQRLLMGDAGARDAALHAIQVCVPDARLIPVGVERIDRWAPLPDGPLTVHARERSQRAGAFLYDVDLALPDGTPLERWQGLELRAVGGERQLDRWPAALLGTLVERRARALAGVALRIQVELGPDGVGLRASSLRPSAPGFGCHAQTAGDRSEERWRELLGPEAFERAAKLSAERAEALSLTCTRLFCAFQALRHARVRSRRLEPEGDARGAWLWLRAGAWRVATHAAHADGLDETVVIALAGRPSSEDL